jgi:hypothetical protein
MGAGLLWVKSQLSNFRPLRERTPPSWDEMLSAAADRPPPCTFRSWSGAAKALGAWLFVGSGLMLAHHFYTSQPMTPPKPPRPVLHTTEVAVGTAGSMFFVMATVNGLEMPFMVDSGSSDICLPDILIGDLRRRGLLTDADWRGSGHATVADGRVVPNKAYNLAQVTIGTWTVNNVAASSCGKGRIPLLGQSVLGRFTSWSLDNRRNVLILTAPKQ